MKDHPSWEKLNEYADGVLEGARQRETAAHLESCRDCRDTVERLRRLVAFAPSLREVQPPGLAWDGVSRAIARQKDIPFPRRRPRFAGRVLAMLAAAAVLVIASSSATVLLMRRDGAVVQPAGAIGNAALPRDLAGVEAGYLRTVQELTVALAASRSKLSPATVRTVEQSLRVIDAAIAEVRLALLADPESGLLRDILGNHYVQKIDLLRRAAERAPIA